ncbi:type I-F CRISPR-associated helicase Cas3 [Burkholderia sp. Leaf177]|uniref:type I-F CRISPR-associated helicase Cas3f n=1 Tax=Burkholderia sp. Leaf177 TaxID=1736287 RepID=UPI0006FD191B|nr:type I-F CRISPR-associated helicase Cas3f [Burkholderia sp. Leaf177]KQR74511.1 type I-F CRISPR-associated helicase Cas3 [Burkholderia sp. Leaf177]
MNVLFVSQCSKRALTETRRVLDQFAERRGERTWQTPITQAGLDTVRRLLRQNARKNTAVACHWIRGRDHSELLWIVGDARQFNADGAVPTHATAKNVLRANDENTWHSLPTITAMVALAALVHDLGKATQAFQERLLGRDVQERNHFRHEWVSIRLFQSFVGESRDDKSWLSRLAACADEGIIGKTFEAQWLDHRAGRLLRDGMDDQAANCLPFATLPPLAQAVAWLVLTHHRLPCRPVLQEHSGTDANEERTQTHWKRFGAHFRGIETYELKGLFEKISADWNEPGEPVPDLTVAKYWRFPSGLPVAMGSWRKQAARYASKLLELPHLELFPSALDDPFVMHVSRLCLMLADHHYSRVEDEGLRKRFRNPHYPLYANTLGKRSIERLQQTGTRPFFNQTLDEHLLGVQAHASLVARSLPSLADNLPALQNHRGLRKRSANARFHWQDKAADLAAGVRSRAAEHGAFIVNMASTGCGKTLGNARIMNALAEPRRGMRCVFAIGLRTLTMQTGRSFQHDLGLNDEQLAIKVGGAASRAVFEYWESQAEAMGSASAQALLDEGGQVLFEGNDQHPLLQRLTNDAQVRSLIAAPVLVCTVDHLTPATESMRGGRQIAPMLRLMTSDLVLDEPDDFGMEDLPALARLVHWAGLLGARVLLSSATLPPALVRGLYLAYLDGRSHYQRNRSERPAEPPRVACLWIDEFAQSHVECSGEKSFADAHEAFVNKRCAQLARTEIRRRAELVQFPAAWQSMQKDSRREALAGLMLELGWALHQDQQNHCVDPGSGKRVSFGLVRMANIGPLFDVAIAMYRQGAPAANVRVHLCVYHSQFPLLARSNIEQQLDSVFDRRPGRSGDDPALLHPSVRPLLDAHPEADHMFVVLASPVCEVGRDWDADWAIAEPSSIRSLIQLAGRVRRHRNEPVARRNMLVFDTNLRFFERHNNAMPVFCMPGFEMKQTSPPTHREESERQDSVIHFHLRSHRLTDLLPDGGNGWPIDARPRVQQAAKLDPRHSLIDLEHARMRDAMLPRDETSKFYTPVARDATRHWYVREADGAQRILLTGLLPQLQRFRHDPLQRDDVVLLPSDDEDELRLHRVIGQRGREPTPYADIRNLLIPVRDCFPDGRGIGPWCHVDLMELLRQWADAQGQSLYDSAKQVATVSLPKSEQGWLFHPMLGFKKV